MKKVIITNVDIKINDSKWIRINQLGYRYEEPCTSIANYNNFDVLWEDAKKYQPLFDCEIYTKLFNKNKKYIIFNKGYDNEITITNYKKKDKNLSIQIKKWDNEIEDSVSIDTLMRKLSAEDFIEYLKNSGINVIKG